MLSADDPQFAEALLHAGQIVSTKFGYPPRLEHLDQANSIASEAVFRASLKYEPSRGVFTALSDAYVRTALADYIRRHLGQSHGPLSGAEESSQEKSELIPVESLAGLTPRQAVVVRGKYELGQTFGEIGRATGTTRQAAQRTHKRAIGRLSRRLTKPSSGADGFF